MTAQPLTHLVPFVPRQPGAEEQDLATSLAGRSGLDLVIEMAHDLRSPLSSVLVLAESLADGRSGPVNERQRRQLGMIQSAVLGLCSTASDVVELARGGQRCEQECVLFSVREVLESVRDLTSPTAEEKGLELLVESPAHDRRQGHPRALSRVVLNLTSNALKVTEAGSVVIAAREIGRSTIEFSVTDTGPGIDADALRTLYQPVRQSGTDARHNFSGSGLGLAICRRLVRAMDSQLHVETEPGSGTRFFFDLWMPPTRTTQSRN
ncbi:MAG TPA: HAMP domain-containing sensor histidine kinase [Gemmatimonadales bacterium]